MTRHLTKLCIVNANTAAHIPFAKHVDLFLNEVYAWLYPFICY